MSESRLILIEDDPAVRHGSAQALSLAGLEVRAFADAEEALPEIDEAFPGVVVSDVKLPGLDGLALMRRVLAADREIPVILVTGHGDITMAVEAMRDGAYDFIEKPFASARLVEVVRRGLDKRGLVIENRRLREQLLREGDTRLIGESEAMQRVRRLVLAVAATDVDVLIRGETGTGKEVVARALHRASGRTGPLVALNCGALPESVFESEVFGHEAGAFTGALKRRIGKMEFAGGGTLFLDEIESMPLSLQVKMLRVLQERVVERLGGNDRIPVDCRVVAATKSDLRGLADQGKFRADLLYRLDVVAVDLPPLRQRREDIPLLFAHFLHQAADRYRLPAPQWSADAMRRWVEHDWPGNVRELKNVAERFCLGVPTGAAAPEVEPTSLPEKMDRFERSLLDQALRQGRGNVTLVAQSLGLPKKTLYDKLRRYGMDPERYRSG
jgi:two-component system, NtrC family, C4-dicarboxylate transport response regulator DctD